MLRERSANGVFGSKMMWNYFSESLDRLRAVTANAAMDDAGVLAAHLPNLRYVWLRRRDVVRQGVSWWRAAETGEYALARDGQPAPPPTYDATAIGRLVRYARDCDAAWAAWFRTNRVDPLVLFYEDMIEDLGGTVESVLDYLEIARLSTVIAPTPRLRRQADADTERFVELFLASGLYESK